MKEISSSHNEIYKHLKKLLSSSKHRRQTGQTVLEGVHLCQGYLKNVGMPLMCVYTDHAKENVEALQIIEQCEHLSVEAVLISQSKFQSISILESGIGIMFVVAQPELKATGSISENALLLDGIQDPGNLGTILRTAAAAGISSVYVSEGSVGAWSPKVLRSGMGGILPSIFTKIAI